MTDLGYANGWGEAPEIVKQCKKEGHYVKSENLGNCLNMYTCEICKYKYKVDSSD